MFTYVYVYEAAGRAWIAVHRCRGVCGRCPSAASLEVLWRLLGGENALVAVAGPASPHEGGRSLMHCGKDHKTLRYASAEWERHR